MWVLLYKPGWKKICNNSHTSNTHIDLQGGTIKLSSWRKQHYSFILKLLLKKSVQVTWLCNRADIYSMSPPSASITASIRIWNWEHAFSACAGGSSVNTRRMVAIRLVLVLWKVMLAMFSTYDLTGSGRGRRGPVREGYKVVALLLKPRLGLFGLVGRCRVLLPHPGPATGHPIAPGDHHTLQHIQVHFGVDF